MVRYSAIGLALSALATTSVWAADGKPLKPNIVFIVADDQGWKDVGFHGSDIKTPNIDTLAEGGARLEEFYAQPMCTPTRAALMTGRYPFRYGLQIAIPSAQYLWPSDRRVAAAAGIETGRLRDRDDRQVAPRPRRQQVLAAPARLRLSLWADARRDRLLHARAAWRARLVPQRQAGQGAGLFDNPARRRGREADRRARSENAAVPRSRLQRAARALSGAEGRSRPLQGDRRPDAARLRGAGFGNGRRDRERGARARREGHARQHAHRLQERQRRHAQRDVLGRGRRLEAEEPAAGQRPLSRRQGHGLRGRHARRGARQLARPHQARRRDRPDDPRRRPLSDAHRSRGRERRQGEAAARRPQRLAERSAKASRRRAPRWSTTSSRSARACARATGS